MPGIRHSSFIIHHLKRLVVLVSGFGSNLQAIIDACVRNELNASLVAVISNKADAFGLQRAIDASIPAVALPFYKDLHLNRAGYDEVLGDVIATYAPNLIVCAGWMRIFSPAFVRRFAAQIINIHPALPGTFPGAHGIADAFAAFQRGEIMHTGVMVHYVDDGVDTGPVIVSEAVPIHSDDSLASLEQRIHTVEHRLIVDAIRRALNAIA
jgi:formyltetrahydrofolate-dependent phosphoribosylglycinamide formyltransferase